MQCIIMEKHCNQINTVIKLKSDLMNQFTIDMGVDVHGIHPDSKLCKICTIIDGPALIQVLGKPVGCVMRFILILNCVKYVLSLTVLL